MLGVLRLPAQVREAAAFLAYDPIPAVADAASLAPGNVFVSAGGMNIQIATIYSVKGETHDATLPIETKHRRLFDVKEMLPHLINPALEVPAFDPAHATTNSSIKAAFMKKAYVAASRPKYVLSIAMGRDRITDAQSGTSAPGVECCRSGVISPKFSRKHTFDLATSQHEVLAEGFADAVISKVFAHISQLSAKGGITPKGLGSVKKHLNQFGLAATIFDAEISPNEIGETLWWV